MRIYLSWEDQFGVFHQFQTKNNMADAIRTAKFKSKKMKRRFKITDANGTLLDLINCISLIYYLQDRL